MTLLGAGVVGALAMSSFTTSQAVMPAADGAKIRSDVEPLIPADPIFGPGSEWTRDVSEAPVAAESGRLVDLLANQVTDRYGGVAAFNDSQYNVSVYTVPADQPTVDLAFDDCQGKGYVPAEMVEAEAGGVLLDVPMPKGAEPAKGTDGALSVYQPASDTLWEFWQTSRTVDGGWQACWGGRIDDASKSPGHFTGNLGVAASGMSVVGGAVGLREAIEGDIDHALSLAIPEVANWQTFSYPAQRSDGGEPAGEFAIAEGQRFRLDPSLDVDALDLHPVAAMIARAAQEHGFIVTDRSGAVAVIAERGPQEPTSEVSWEDLRDGTPSYAVMEDFPWDELEALPWDYGRG